MSENLSQHRARHRKILCCALLCLLPSILYGQRAFAPYAARSEFLLSAPGASDSGLYGYTNPAQLNYVESLENILAFSTAPTNSQRPQNQWALFSGMRHLGFTYARQEQGRRQISDYRLAISGGGRRLGLGLGYGFSSGDTRFFARQNHYALGLLWRPDPRLSVGATLTSTFSAKEREGAIDLGFRPWKNDRLTLFADYARARGSSAFWSAGGDMKLVPGLHLTARFFENSSISFGLRLDLGTTGISTQSRFDDGHTFNTYAIRLGGYRRSLSSALIPRGSRFLQLELNGPVRHRRFALFDDGRTLVGLLTLIERARRDQDIGGIAINASGLRINREMAWELREKLRQLQAADKRVVIYIDNATLPAYHFASVADHLVLDPAGLLVLDGYVAGSTYLKGALDKLGIGVDEWRFFDYKSAYETFTRTDMSAAAREQSQALVDDFYALAREEISASRQLSPDEFDRLVDEETLFLPQEALKRGLVDALGRWSQIEDITHRLGGRGALIHADAYLSPTDTRWGQRPRVAIVYALGICALDSGIRARTLAKELKSVCKDAAIDAVVLRVDSPGGEVLASDLLADEVRACRAYKPIVVSQGYIAASGGYWLSMYADAIVAAPNTITGSIGVIGGWVYNTGLKEKIGLSTDRVQAGRHADLPFGLVLPLIGLPLPDRNLSADERAKAERVIRSLYADFVAKAAASRDMRPFELDERARGRVWSGRRAVENGLIDTLGGLDTAIRLAVEKAGLPAESRIELVEVPRISLINPGLLQPRLIAAPLSETSHLTHYLRFRLRHNGRPLLLTPTAYWQDELFGGAPYAE